MAYQDYVSGAEKHYQQHKDVSRKGQAYMHYLYMICPDSYTKVTGTDNDPFYIDGKLPAFLMWLAENWE